ncbi:hypothetical protein [Vibrio anguillarum]|uniref:hypothetical protein n=3 Tax=Vibrio anguillarum TaxID=55601 RepID=UPI000BB480A4|nr:hypothetical protein [Vibrio anguillarum]ATC60183.1 hypothetical protein CMV05_22600 [Vibrio anguillarum]MBF4250657.1 hypothetical protein [Vibrio anguillarum]MBF4342095.1 hypothetical protein [Vibrio anguillarum]
MQKRSICSLVLMLMVAGPSQSALRIHSTPQKEAQAVIPSDRPEDDVVTGRARGQRLEDALTMLTKNKLTVTYINPQLKDMPVNWRANGEPLQILLTNLSRGYGIDVVINEPKETVYIDVDTGQCDATRERELLTTRKMWLAMNIDDLPRLPPRLPLVIDASGHEYRLC